MEPGTGGSVSAEGKGGRRRGSSRVKSKREGMQTWKPGRVTGLGWWYEHGEKTAHSSLHVGLCTCSLHLLSLATLYTVVALLLALFFCFILSINAYKCLAHLLPNLCIVSLPLKCKPTRARILFWLVPGK